MKLLPLSLILSIAIFAGFSAAAEEFIAELREAMRQECLRNLTHPDGKELTYEKRLKAYTKGCDCMIKTYVEHAPAAPLQERFDAGQRMLGLGDVEKSIPREVQVTCLHVIDNAVKAELEAEK